MNFHGFSKSPSTSRNSISELPTSLGMLGYVSIAFNQRSRDLEGYYTGRVAARGRIKSSKVGCFAFRQILANRRCVRPYLASPGGCRKGFGGSKGAVPYSTNPEQDPRPSAAVPCTAEHPPQVYTSGPTLKRSSAPARVT